MIETYVNYTDSDETFINYLENVKPSDVVIIKNCPSTVEASKLISYDWFATKLFEKFPTVIAVRLKIETNFNEKDAERPKQHEFILKYINEEGKEEEQTRFVVSFESNNGEKIVIFWRNNSSKEFIKFQMIEDRINAHAKLFTFYYFIGSLKEGYDVTSSSGIADDLVSLTSPYCKNLLLYAVVRKDLIVLKEFLELPFDINEKMWDGTYVDEEETKQNHVTIVDFVSGDTKNEMIFELLKANSLFPKKIDKSNMSVEIKEFLGRSEDMHEAIKSKDKDKVAKILYENENLRYFLTDDNCSALNRAFKYGNKEIYKLLAQHNVTFSPDEDIRNNLTENFRDMISDLNSQFSQFLPENHISMLMSRSVIPHGDSQYNQRSQLVKTAFEIINKIREVSLQLQIISTSPKLKIHFDFTQFTVNYMDPCVGSNTDGLFNVSTHHLHIAAKRLLNEQTMHETHGVISHESCHFCMHLVFRNKRQPFGFDDEVNKQRFMEILKECEKLKDQEIIIGAVFDYDKINHAQELIVRVPHLLARYQNDQTKLTQLKTTFKSLFDYYNQVVMPEMRLALLMLKKLLNESTSITYNQLTGPYKAAILNSYVIFQGKKIKLKDIADDYTLTRLVSKQIRNILDGKFESIGKKLERGVNFYINRDFVSNNIKIEIESVIQEVKNSKVVLLSDQAGAGKTTTLKHFSVQLKEKNPNYFIYYVDLKQHLTIYEKFDQEIYDITQKSDEKLQHEQKDKLLEIILKTLSPIMGFERATFIKLFNLDKLILLFDAVDEIAPKFEQFCIKLIKNINILTKNQQWIATRPQHTEELKSKLNCKPYTLLPFNSSTTKEFIEKCIDPKKCTDIKTKVEEITKISSSLKFINNPLMLKMIIKLHLDGKLGLESLNRYELYDEMMKLNLKILNAEKGEIANLDRDNLDSNMTLWQIHQIYAMLLTFKDIRLENFLTPNTEEIINFDDFALLKKWKKQKIFWTPEAVSRYGILTIRDWKKPKERPEFLHRTFAEYFVAKFIIEIIEESVKSDEEDMTKKQFDLNMKLALSIIGDYCNETSNTEGVWSFIADYLLTYDLENLELGELFNHFITSKKVENFVRKMPSMKIAKIVINMLKLSQFHEDKILKNLTLSDGNRSDLFQTLFSDPDCVIECAELFNAFKLSGLLNWHLLTGFGSNLTNKQLDLITNIKIYDDDLNKSHSEICIQFLEFFSISNDVPIEKLDTFLTNFTKKFAFLVLNSEIFIKNFFVIIQKQMPIVKRLNYLSAFFLGLRIESQKLFSCINNPVFITNLNILLDNYHKLLTSENLLKFHENYFTEILWNSLCCKFLLEKVLETIENVFVGSNDEFTELLKISVNFKSDLDDYLIDESGMIFLGKKLKEFDMIECIKIEDIYSPWYSHPLISSINCDRKESLKYFHENLTVKDVLKIFYFNIYEILNIRSLHIRNFGDFFVNFFNSHHSVTYDHQPLDDMTKLVKNETYEKFEKNYRQTYVIYQVLKFSNQVEALEINLFSESFWAIIWCIFCSRSVIVKFFEVFSKHFSGEKLKVAELISDGFDKTSFFNPNNLEKNTISDECRSLIEYFWLKIEEFFNFDHDLIRKVLLSHYEFNHPLIFSIYNKVDNLSEFYFKYCNNEEILNVFMTNLNSVARFYETERFEQFFRDKMLANEEFKNFVNDVDSDGNVKIHVLYDEAIENISADLYMSEIEKEANLLKFLKLLINQITSESDNENFLFHFCFKRTKNLSPESEILLDLRKNVKEFFEFAFNHDVNVLNEIINIKTYEIESYFFDNQSLKFLTFKLFYKKLIECSTDEHFLWLKKFLMIKCEINEFHPLMIAFGYSITDIIELYRKTLNLDQILKILLRHFEQTRKFDTIDPRVFKNFFMSVFSEIFFIEQPFENDITQRVVNQNDHYYQFELKRFEIYFYFLHIVAYIKCQQIDLEQFLNNSLYFIIWNVFRSHSLNVIIFDIFIKHFSNSKLKISEIICKSFDRLGFFNPDCSNSKNITVEFRSLMVLFWLKIEEFFNSDRYLMRKVLLSVYECNHPLIISIYYKIDNLTEFYFKYCNNQEILNAFMASLNSVAGFCNGECFKQFFREKMFETDEFKSFVNAVDKDGNSEFQFFYDRTIENVIEDTFISKQQKEANLSNFLYFLINQIPSESDNENFLFYFCFKFREKLSPESKTLLGLRRNAREFFEFAFNYDLYVLDQILNFKIYAAKDEFYAIDSKIGSNFRIFYRKLIEYVNQKLDKMQENAKIKQQIANASSNMDTTEETVNWLKSFLLINCDGDIIHPLIVALSCSVEDVIELYQKTLTLDEILKILFLYIDQIQEFNEINPKIFINFFVSLCPDNLILYHSEVDCIQTSNEIMETNEQVKHASQVFINFFNLIISIECQQNNLDRFFENSMPSISWCAFRSQSLIVKFFDVFIKHFSDRKLKVAELIRNGFDRTGFFNPNHISNKNIAVEFRSLIEFFWSKVEDFFDSDHDLMEKVLLSHYEYNHPLIISIYYNIDNLNKFYFKYCNNQEILNVFMTNFNSVAHYYDAECFEKFFYDKMLTTDEKKNALKKFFRSYSDTNQTISDIIEKKINGLIGDNYIAIEIIQINGKKFRNFFIEFENNLKVILSSHLDLNQSIF